MLFDNWILIGRPMGGIQPPPPLATLLSITTHYLLIACNQPQSLLRPNGLKTCLGQPQRHRYQRLELPLSLEISILLTLCTVLFHRRCQRGGGGGGGGQGPEPLAIEMPPMIKMYQKKPIVSLLSIFFSIFRVQQ